MGNSDQAERLAELMINEEIKAWYLSGVTGNERETLAAYLASKGYTKGRELIACELLEDLDKHWQFDNAQQHTHTWHTKQDFFEKWRKRLAEHPKGKQRVVLDELKVAIIIQREVRREDVLPKQCVDVLRLETCERIAAKLSSALKPSRVVLDEGVAKEILCDWVYSIVLDRVVAALAAAPGLFKEVEGE